MLVSYNTYKAKPSVDSKLTSLGQLLLHNCNLQVKVPLYGCDCYAYALLASGFVDLVIESGLKVRCATYLICL